MLSSFAFGIWPISPEIYIVSYLTLSFCSANKVLPLTHALSQVAVAPLGLKSVQTGPSGSVPSKGKGWGLAESFPTFRQFLPPSHVDCFCHMTKPCKQGQMCSSNLRRNRKGPFCRAVYSLILNFRPILFLFFSVLQWQFTIWRFLGFSILLFPLSSTSCLP